MTSKYKMTVALIILTLPIWATLWLAGFLAWVAWDTVRSGWRAAEKFCDCTLREARGGK